MVAAGRLYPLDCIIYGSGFEVGTPYARRAGFEVTGRDGVMLSAHWADGMRTLHGIHVHGFPNLLFVQPTQGANLISNVPHNIADSARTIALVVGHAVERRVRRGRAVAAAEDAWVDLLLTGPGSMIGGPDCTPGYYNNEGHDTGAVPGPRLPLRPQRLLRLHRQVAHLRHLRRPGILVTLTTPSRHSPHPHAPAVRGSLLV